MAALVAATSAAASTSSGDEASSPPAAVSKAYEWWNKLGKPKTIVAPMVDQSELAYRMLVREYGADLVYTQMMNSNVFAVDPTYRAEMFQTLPADRPLIVQFCGDNAQTLLTAAKMVEDHCDAVDLNLGCPQGIAKRGHYGAYLMEELDLLSELVSTLAKGLKVPVTCKTRIYKDFDRSLKLCETLVNAGASLLTIHGRTREEKGQYVQECNWETIRRIKQHFQGRVPIIANGGISGYQDVDECLRVTGCDGVMSSEAILECPGMFSQNRRRLRPDEEEEVITVISDEHTSSSSSAAAAAPAAPATTPKSTPKSTPKTTTKTTTKSQVDLADEYLANCRQYPVYHYKAIRSHMQKMLYRYATIHTEIREAISVAREISDFQAIITLTRTLSSSPDNAHIRYDQQPWYTRYRIPYTNTNTDNTNTDNTNTDNTGNTNTNCDCSGGVEGWPHGQQLTVGQAKVLCDRKNTSKYGLIYLTSSSSSSGSSGSGGGGGSGGSGGNGDDDGGGDDFGFGALGWD